MTTEVDEIMYPALLAGAERSRGPGGPVTERIMTAATRLFAERGFEGTSVSDIVKAAGVTKGALYHYVASKDDVLYAIYYRVLVAQEARIRAIVESDASVVDRLHRACVDIVESDIEEFEVTTIFIRSMHQLQGPHNAAIRRLRREFATMYTTLVSQGQEAGDFRSDVTPDVAVNFFFGSVFHLATWGHIDGPMTARQIGEHFADLFLGGLEPQE